MSLYDYGYFVRRLRYNFKNQPQPLVFGKFHRSAASLLLNDFVRENIQAISITYSELFQEETILKEIWNMVTRIVFFDWYC